MCLKTTSTLVYIMAHSLNAMEPNFLISQPTPPPPPPHPIPFLSIIDKYDKLKNTGGNEFILLNIGWGCCMAGNATKTDLLLCWTTHIFLYHMYFTKLNITHSLTLIIHLPNIFYKDHNIFYKDHNIFYKDHSFWSVVTIKECVSQAVIIRGTGSKSALVEMRQQSAT